MVLVTAHRQINIPDLLGNRTGVLLASTPVILQLFPDWYMLRAHKL